MCQSCFERGDIVNRFNAFRRSYYECHSCAVTTNDQCVPRAVKEGQFPPRVFIGPRLDGVGTFGLFDIKAVEAFSIASVDGIPAQYGSMLARHTWMPALATALGTGSIKEVVFVGQTNSPAVEYLADLATAKHPVLSDWYEEHKHLQDLAMSLYGKLDKTSIAYAIPVHAQRQLRHFLAQHYPDRQIDVHTGVYDPDAGTLRWIGPNGVPAQAPQELQQRFESRQAQLQQRPYHPDDEGRFYAGCMDSRAIPSHVITPVSEVAVSSSMGGIWAPHNSKLGRLTMMAELAMLAEKKDLKEIVFMGHTGCAGAKLASQPATDNPLLADWQSTFQNTLIPLAQSMHGQQNTQPDLQAALEKTIPVYMQHNMQAFVNTHYPEKGIKAAAYLFEMKSGNLLARCGEAPEHYKPLTNHVSRDFANLPGVCPQTKIQFMPRVASGPR